MTRADLKPCPFCKGKARVYEFMTAGHIIVECTRLRCSAQGPVRTTDKSAIAAWNRRAPITLDEWEDSQ